MVESTKVLTLHIPQALHDEMIAHLQSGYADEACGALGSVDNRVVKHYPTANAAEFPDDFSIISEKDIVRIYNDIDDYDGEMIYYHSHPRSPAYPSARDVEWAKRGGYPYLIVTFQAGRDNPGVRLFTISPDGSITEGTVIVS